MEGKVIDWSGIGNLVIAAIVTIGLCSFFYWSGTTYRQMTELLLVMVVIFLYAVFLQLSDIKRSMK
jgi:hypothetical protein